ncbi:ion transporter [Halonatronum saccharophilum]|uniref:ion transporter n=1 Tax=Halonatronum saccharophilum TaxID=150060 RepID=UPI0004832650|nr:ion transporter [Halonatronum saccharophilum]
MIFIDDKIKDKLYDIIFETDTRAGKAFDILLIVTILCNSLLIILESVDIIRESYGMVIAFLGWVFIIIFTTEYILRLLVVESKIRYLLSFFGIIDLLAIMPVFFALVFPEVRFLVVVRIFRLLRMFNIFKMGRYIDESSYLLNALRASRAKITVFLVAILFIIVMVGSVMYIAEGPENGFVSIPTSMYWAVVTVSTVGYGDISPQTSIGKMISSLLMIIGYGIIAVPTGIISHELANTSKSKEEEKLCSNCSARAYSLDDSFCSKCGSRLEGG